MIPNRRLILIAIIPVLVLGFLLPVTANKQAINSPQAQTQKSIGAWMPYWDERRSNASFQRTIKLLDEISPYWYYLLPNGQLKPTAKFDLGVLREAKAEDIKVIPMVSNGYNGALVSKVINNSALLKAHINALVSKVTARNLDGIELDYEGLLPQDRNKFTAFVKLLAAELHKRNKLLSVTVQAKVKEPGHNGSTKAQDWKGIGQYADKVHIMAYDYHWKTSPPGPIAPIGWVENIAKLANKTIPSSKAVLAVGTYGYDWRSGRALTITVAQARALAKKAKKRIQRDAKSKELYLRLKPGKPQIWLQDSGSLRLKLQIVKKYDLGGVFFWRLGNEQISYWSVTQQELR